MTGDETEVALGETYEAVESVAEGIVYSNILLTLFFALSFKSMWYLLSIMQVIVLLRPFTAWPAMVNLVMQQVLDAITLDPVVEPILDYGKSKFDIADEKTDDEYLQ